MGLKRAFRSVTVVGGIACCAIAYTNCAPSFQVPSNESLSLSESVGGLCTGGLNLVVKANPRLTAREYAHSLKDLFGGFMNNSVIDQALEGLPKENLSVAHTQLDFDSTIGRSLQFNEAEAYNRIAETVSAAFAAKLKNYPDAAAMTVLLGGNCFVTEALPNDACLKKTYAAMTYRVFRRPAQASELDRVLAIHKDALNVDKFEAIAFATQYLLQTQAFLYKVEGPFDGGGQIYALNDFELATRLSYGIIGGPPPNWLLTAAAKNEVTDDAKRAEIIEKLFAMPEAKRATQDFYDQWLRTAQIPAISEAGLGTSGLDPGTLRWTAVEEIRDYTRHITWNMGGSYRELMTSNLLFPKSNELAQVYGVSRSNQAVAGSNERRGLLTRAGMLMVKSDGRTGPILRGARLRTDLLCDEMMAPPDNVFSNLGTFNPLDSTRKQTEDITRAGSCMSCHSQINTLGFAFENFSGLGAQRTMETLESNGNTRTHAVQTAGTAYMDRAPTNFSNGADLSERIVNGNQGAACMAKRYYQFVAGVAKTSNVGCEFSAMSDELSKNQGSILGMMKSYYARPEIRYRRPGVL